MKSALQDLRLAVAVGTALFALFLVFEAPVDVAVTASLMIIAQSWAGIVLIRMGYPNQRLDYLVCCVYGFALGTSISLLGALLLRPYISPSLGWFIPIAILGLYSTFSRRDVSNSAIQMSGFAFELSAIVVISFLYLAQDSNWPAYLFFGGTLIVFSLKFISRTRHIFFLIGLPIACASFYFFVLSFMDRAPYWWYLSDDFRMFESLSRSIWNYGPNDSLGTLATIGAQYHYVTYAYSGLIDLVSNSSEFIVLNKITLVVCALSMSAIVIAILKREGAKIGLLSFCLAACYPLFFDYSFTSPSYCFGLFFFLVAVYYWTDFRNSDSYLLRIIFNLLFMTMLMLSKVSNVPAAIAGLAFLAFYGYMLNTGWKIYSLINLFSSSIAAGIYFVLFLANGRSSTQINSFYAFGYAQRLAGDLISIENPTMRIIASLMYTSIYLALPLFGTIFFLLLTKKEAPTTLLFALPALPLVVITALFGGHDMSGYFVLSALGLLNLTTLLYLQNSLKNQFSDKQSMAKLLLLGALSAVAVLVFQQAKANFNGSTSLEIVVRSFFVSTWLIPIFIVPLFYFFLRKNLSNRRLWIASSLIFSALVSLMTVEFNNLDRMTKGGELESSQSWVAIGTPDQQSVGKWLLENTFPTDLIATNHFCGKTCAGPDWFANDMNRLDSTLNIPASDTGYGGFNFWLSLYSQRRFLVEGSRFLLINGMDREVLLNRMNASLEFANEPLPSNLFVIQSLGVDYFVVDKESTSVQDWTNFANTKYENETFIVLELL